MPTFELESYAFMRAHAGVSWRPSLETREQGAVRGALELARAEYALNHDFLASVQWERDHDAECWDQGIAEPPFYQAMLMRWDAAREQYECLASLGAIDVGPDDPYARVVAAELALEAGICHPMDRRIR